MGNSKYNSWRSQFY